MIESRLSKRLEAIVSHINCRVLADIGTDHGYTPVAACELNRAKFGIACDISINSLRKAESYIRKKNMSDRIETRLGGGFDPILSGEADTAVITGIGGMLIRDIIQDGLSKAKGIGRLILGPQRDIPALRQSLNDMGIIIKDEEMLMEGGIFYNILICEPGSPKILTPEGRMFGQALIDKADPILRLFLLKLIEKNSRILEQADKEALEEELLLAVCVLKQKGWEAWVKP